MNVPSYFSNRLLEGGHSHEFFTPSISPVLDSRLWRFLLETCDVTLSRRAGSTFPLVTRTRNLRVSLPPERKSLSRVWFECAKPCHSFHVEEKLSSSLPEVRNTVGLIRNFSDRLNTSFYRNHSCSLHEYGENRTSWV